MRNKKQTGRHLSTSVFAAVKCIVYCTFTIYTMRLSTDPLFTPQAPNQINSRKSVLSPSRTTVPVFPKISKNAQQSHSEISPKKSKPHTQGDGQQLGGSIIKLHVDLSFMSQISLEHTEPRFFASLTGPDHPGATLAGT